MTNPRVNAVRIEVWSAEGVEIGNQTSVWRIAKLQVLFSGDALVNACADDAGLAEVAMQPGSVSLSDAPFR